MTKDYYPAVVQKILPQEIFISLLDNQLVYSIEISFIFEHYAHCLVMNDLTAKKKILICDDHPLFTDGLTQLLLMQTTTEYVIEAVNDTLSCAELIQKTEYAIFICDLNIDKQDGFVLIEKMDAFLQNTRKIVLSAYCETFLIKKAQKMGIQAYLKKDTPLSELIEVIESSKPFYTNASIQAFDSEYDQMDEQFKLKFKLSKQEKKIIQLLIQGKTSKEIGDELFITKTTVDTHRRNINRKLEVSNVSSLYKFAYENKLVD